LEDDLSSVISYYLEDKEESEGSKKVISDYLDSHEQRRNSEIYMLNSKYEGEL